MKLIFWLVLGAAFLVVLPFALIWGSGSRGPALACMALAGCIAIGGLMLAPGPERWPETASGLDHVSGVVKSAKSVRRGDNEWYELKFDGPPHGIDIWDSAISEDAVRSVIGRRVQAGLYRENSNYSWTTLSLESDGKVLIDYGDVLKKHREEAEGWLQISRGVLVGAAALAAIGIITLIVQNARAKA